MVESNEQEIRDKQLIEKNIELLNTGISSIQYRLQHSSLSRQYCDKYPSGAENSKKSCDCVNLRVSQLFSEIFPTNAQLVKQSRNNNVKNSSKNSTKKQTPTSSGPRKIDEVLHSLSAENEELRNLINQYEKKLDNIQSLILN